MRATRLGILRQILASVSLGFSIIIMGTMLAWPAPTLAKIKEKGKPFKLSSTEISWMVSLIYLGNFLSPLPIGYLMDYIGRKNAMLMMTVIPLASWVLIMFSHEAIMLCVARFLNGIWCATVTTITPLYLSEISEPKLRGVLSTFIQFDVNIGVLFEYCIGPFVGYELLAALSASFPLYFVFFFWNMPESPYWLSMKVSDDAAAHALAWLRGEKVDNSRVIEEINELSLGVHEEMQHPRNFKDLVATRGHRKALLIVEILAIAQRCSGISPMLAFISTTLPQKNIGLLTTNYCVIVIGCVWTVCVLTATYLIDYWGRKPLLLLSSIGCAIGTFIAGTWFFLDTNTSINVSSVYWLPFAGFIVYSIFFSIGLGPIASTEQGEMFSVNDRALASAITSMVLAMSSFICNRIYIPIEENVGMFLNYWLFTIVSILTAIFVYFVVIETKGKTLRQIHEELEL